MNKNTEEIEIDLREILCVIWRYMWLITLIAVVLGASSFLFAKFVITPTYESNTRVVVLSKQNTDTLTYNDLQMGSQLTKDYVELILSRHVIEQVISDFGLDMSYEQFADKIKVETPANTRIIDITLTDADPVKAKEYVDAVRNVAAIRIKEVMDIEAVNIVDEGNIATSPSNPSVLKYTVLGFFVGVAITIAFVVIRFLLDDTIKTPEDIERYLQLSTLAQIPIIPQENGKKSDKRRKKFSESETDSLAGKPSIAEDIEVESIF